MTEGSAPGVFTSVAPSFLTTDVVRTAEWYRDHLGFTIGEYYLNDHEHPDEDGPHARSGEAVFVIVHRDNQRIMFGWAPPDFDTRLNDRREEGYTDAYFWMTGIREFHQWVASRGAGIAQDLVRQPYGLDEFRVRDCDGRIITFGEFV